MAKTDFSLEAKIVIWSYLRKHALEHQATVDKYKKPYMTNPNLVLVWPHFEALLGFRLESWLY